MSTKQLFKNMNNIYKRLRYNPIIREQIIHETPIYGFWKKLSLRIDDICLYQDELEEELDGNWENEFHEISKDPTGMLARIDVIQCNTIFSKIIKEIIDVSNKILTNKEITYKTKLSCLFDLITSIEFDMNEEEKYFQNDDYNIDSNKMDELD